MKADNRTTPEKLETFAIWRNHSVIGCYKMTEATRQEVNATPDLKIYIGFDPVTNPENYKQNR